ncbi:5-formyltetrahydrofolate cyclo-ligase [Bacillus sp. FJAT-49732]|uniref:5-formyltetrahydrofolate cyclo-ligase n=1 Tax=Lederbergia citrisecunda TaxID=2833583 RepID=A0A942YLI2_9BACI|nr:5-formyltetrahydrofolate cyclo-ligase [Lederbergia citrisecunda]MBS4199670.1 5-formyltetrahydrofolate cyclo-ligase [Lederbergia citrisecunda]
MDKTSIRKKYKEKLKSLDRITYEHQSYTIANKLFQTNEWKNAEMIGITVSHFPEVDTWQLIRRGWEEGKKIVIPKCYPSDKKMEFRQITAFDQMVTVFFGLFEPIETKTMMAEKKEIDLLLVPGLVFNRQGYRIGFGGGYYDRFLTEFNGNTISLCFSMQISENIPIENHDIPVNKIITENEMITVEF